MIRIACDVHTHTLFSRHAYSTLEENVRAASAKNLELLGVTDHFSCMLFDQQTLKNFQYFINGAQLKHPTTLKKRVFRDCDYVIASIHRKDFTLGQTPAQNTQMYINALQDPKVLILGHVGRSGVDFELDPVLEAARDLGKLIEINESSIAEPAKAKKSLQRCEDVARRCAELGCMVSFGSDAHISPKVGGYAKTKELLESVDFPEELVACSSAERFLSLLP